MRLLRRLFAHRDESGVAGRVWVGTGAAVMTALVAGILVTNPGSGSGGICTSPVASNSGQGFTYTVHNTSGGFPGIDVNNNVWNPQGSPLTQTLNVCSGSSWYVDANIAGAGDHSIISYPDARYYIGYSNESYTGGTGPMKTFGSYVSMNTCFAENSQIGNGNEWDLAYDNWLAYSSNTSTSDTNDIEVMVWSRWDSDISFYLNSSRAVTIDGRAYHMFKGGGANEWIYTMDQQVTSGCIDLKPIYADLVAHPSTSGMTNNAIPSRIEYGVEVAKTNGSQRFSITNFTWNPS